MWQHRAEHAGRDSNPTLNNADGFDCVQCTVVKFPGAACMFLRFYSRMDFTIYRLDVTLTNAQLETITASLSDEPLKQQQIHIYALWQTLLQVSEDHCFWCSEHLLRGILLIVLFLAFLETSPSAPADLLVHIIIQTLRKPAHSSKKTGRALVIKWS